MSNFNGLRICLSLFSGNGKKGRRLSLIFHFYDDYSNPNLGTKNRIVCRDLNMRDSKVVITYSTPPSSRFQSFIDDGIYGKSLGKKAIMTWAPSHPELGYLAEVLRYANIIDGLSEEEKRYLRFDLELVVGMSDRQFAIDEKRIEDLDFRFADKKKLVFFDENIAGKMALCVELCQEYIDYLKLVLKQHLKD